MEPRAIHLADEEYVSDVYFKDSSDMKEIENEKISLILTSPPYYNLKDYSELKAQDGQLPASPENYHQTYPEYLDMLRKVFSECFRVLKRDGIFILNIDIIKIKTEDKNIIPLPFDALKVANSIGFGCKDILIYKKLTGVPFEFGNKLKNRHEYLLLLAKSNEYTFNLDTVRIPYAADYIYPPGHKRRNPIGMAPSTVWEFYPPFQSGGKNHYHYCPFPYGLVDRAIKLFTNKGDWVLDPFLGSGQVLARAKFLRRNGVGFELDDRFHDTIMVKIEETRIGSDQEIERHVDYTIEKNEPKAHKKAAGKLKPLDTFF